MGDFRQDGGKRFGGGRGGGFGRRDGGRGGFGGSRDRGPVTMHQTICAQCGKPCEVPFVPTSGRPVYCNDCFGGKKETGGGNFRAPIKPDFRGDVGKGENYELKRQLEILNTKMDRLIRVVEIMANIKPSITEEKAKKTEKTVPVVKAKKSVKKVSKK
ncbi:MAG: hypothetical protein Q8N59_00115 [bacterium]|nr:hypothetical protein [bacterium]